MRVTARSLVAIAACVFWLAGCDKTSQQLDLASSDGGMMANPPAPVTEPETTATITNATLVPAGSVELENAAADGLVGSNQNDDLNLGKRHFRERDYGLAERYFRRAVEM